MRASCSNLARNRLVNEGATNNRWFCEQWQRHQYVAGRIHQECRRIIQAPQEELALKRELLGKNNSEEHFNYYNDKLASMGDSLELILFNRRLRKYNFIHRDNSNSLVHGQSHAHFNNHPSSSTPQNHNDKRKRTRRKNTKPPPTCNTNTPLDPSSVVNLSHSRTTKHNF